MGITDIPRLTVLAGLELPERYQVVRRIANGGMASVWCATDHALGRYVAIKVLSEPFAHDEVAVRRFKREALAAARLSSHPHVVTIYDVGEAPHNGDMSHRAFMVMEYLAGGTLADALRVGAVSRDEAVRWVREAASALDYAHGRGVVHRDIKLANFLLDSGRSLHVADFGIAQLGTEDTLTGTGQMLGTAAYLAPERALGHPATESSDRYSLAVAAFELLAGERPFRAEHFAALARQHIEDHPPRASALDPSLPRALDRVLAQGMAKRPEARYATAGAFADALERALSRHGAGRRIAAVAPPTPRTARLATAPPRPARVERPARRRSHRGLAIGALAAAALAAVVAIVVNDHSAAKQTRVALSGTTRHATTTTPAAQQTRKDQHTSSGGTTSTSQTSTTASNAAPAATPPASASALEARGYQQMASGDYQAAISTLRQAVAAAAPTSLTYAYALYNLGRSLRLSGDPRAAIPVLWQRLQIPNQTDVVRQELQLALQAVGQQLQGAAPPGHDHGNGPGGGGPPGQGQGD